MRGRATPIGSGIFMDLLKSRLYRIRHGIFWRRPSPAVGNPAGDRRLQAEVSRSMVPPATGGEMQKTKNIILAAGMLVALSVHPGSAAETDSQAGWPMWGRDAARSHVTPAALPDDPQLLWTRELPAPQRAWRPQHDDFDKLEFDVSYVPVAMDGLVFVPSMVTDSVTAYRLTTGEQVWRTTVDGPVRLAPVVWNGRVYFVSDDGHLHVVNAADGEPLWNFRAAPSVRKLLGNERVISMWPARGGPVIKAGTIYFAAGIWPFKGIFLYALDAQTGELRWQNTADGTRWMAQPHGGAYAFAGIAPQGYLAVAGDHLIVSGGRTPPALFNRHSGAFVAADIRGKAGGADRPFGGYRVKTDGRYVYNHGRQLRLTDGSQSAHLWADIVDAGTVYRGERGTLTATDTENPDGARELWRATIPGLRALHLKTADRLVADGTDGSIMLLRTDNEIDEDGNSAPEIVVLPERVDAPVTDILLSDGILVAVTEHGTLYAFGAAVTEAQRHAYDPEPLTPAADNGWMEPVQQLLSERPSMNGGYALVVGAGDESLIDTLLTQTELHLLITEQDAETVRRQRDRLIAAGMYGRRAAILSGDPMTLDLPPYIFCLVASGSLDTDDETARNIVIRSLAKRLRPYHGVALLAATPDETALTRLGSLLDDPVDGTFQVSSWQGLTRIDRDGPLPGAGQWTHQYADSANTVRSQDERIRLPLGILWFGGPNHDNILPRHAAGPRPQVAAGRLTILGVESLNARDVYTGRELWHREFPGIGHPFTALELEEKWEAGEAVYMLNQPGAAYIGSPYVTLPDSVYLRYQHKIYRLDPETGEDLAVFDLPSEPRENEPDWGHISVLDDALITTVNPHIFDDGHLGELNWDASSSEKLVVLDRMSGEVRWTREARIGFRHNAIASANGRLFLIDGVSENARGFLARRGRLPEAHSTLMALDIHSGEKLWENDSEIFGTFLGYSEEYDVLLETGTRDSRRHLPDEPRNRMAVRSGQDGSLLWERGDRMETPAIIHGSDIVPGRPGVLRDLLTGEDKARRDPLTGIEIAHAYWKAYGCATASASRNLLLFRSGAAGYYDLERGGTGTLGGFKSGCTANMTVADGILNAPDYTRTCTCSYQNQTSLGLIHMPDMDMWTFDQTLPDPELGTLRRVGINFGAIGARMDEYDTLWLEYPVGGAPSPSIRIQVDPEPTLQTVQHHSLRVTATDGSHGWIGASVIEGMRRIRLSGLYLPEPSGGVLSRAFRAVTRRQTEPTYTVKLHFAELLEPDGPRDRMFDIWIQGKRAVRSFDPVRAAGGAQRVNVVEIGGIRPTRVTDGNGSSYGVIEVEFDPARGAIREPTIAGMQITIEE